jgi:hypothetical protein
LQCGAVMTAAEAECWGLPRALEWLNSLMDCKMAVDVNKQIKSLKSTMGSCKIVKLSSYGILQDCKTLPVNHNNYRVVFGRHQTNDNAHALVLTKEVTLNDQRTKFGDILWRMLNAILHQLDIHTRNNILQASKFQKNIYITLMTNENLDCMRPAR